MKSLRLGRSYNNNPEINLIIRYLMNLAFIHQDEIPHFLTIIEGEIEKITEEKEKYKIKKLFNYYKNTWVNGRFQIEDWNQVLDISFRTNNWSESFHSCFSRKFNCSHPSINKLVSILEQTMTMNKKLQGGLSF